MPKHLHLVHDPRTQRRVTRRITNDKRARIPVHYYAERFLPLITQKITHTMDEKIRFFFPISHQQKHKVG